MYKICTARVWSYACFMYAHAFSMHLHYVCRLDLDCSSIWVPTCLHFHSQNPLKSHSDLDRHRFLIDFCIDFLSIFKGFGRHLGTQVGAMLLTFSPRSGFQTNPSAQDTHHAPRTPPGSFRTSILMPLRLNFVPILDRFWMDFGWIFSWIWL